MAENKTKPTVASVDDHIASRAKPAQLADCRKLMEILQTATQEQPKMWGPSIVGYGSYRYIYESGRSGESPLAAFAIRGADLVVYLSCEGERPERLLAKLGKHKMGKSCLYLKSLADLDLAVLEQLIECSIEQTRQRYP
jgi:hypothetical protein